MDPESRNVSRKRLDSVTFMFEGDQAIPNVATSPAILHHNYDSGGTEEQVWTMTLLFKIKGKSMSSSEKAKMSFLFDQHFFNFPAECKTRVLCTYILRSHEQANFRPHPSSLFYKVK